MVLIFILFLWHIFFPLSQVVVSPPGMVVRQLAELLPGGRGETVKTESQLSFEKFLQLDDRGKFNYLKSLGDKKGVGFTWRYFVKAYTQNNQVILQQPLVHLIAHQVGQMIYDSKGFNGISICTMDFAFGCYHGFLDKAFRKDLSGLEKAISECRKLEPINSLSFESCAHGIGHGVASYYMVSDLPNALKTCETLSAGQMSCVDGVFMEFALDSPFYFYKKSDPLYPCDIVNQKYIRKCGVNQALVMEERFFMTNNIIANICYRSLNIDFKLGCFDGLIDTVSYKSQGNVQYILEKCREIGLHQFYSECLKYAAGDLASRNLPDSQKNSLFLCDAMPDGEQASCSQPIFRRLDHKQQFEYLTFLAEKRGLAFSWQYFVASSQSSASSQIQGSEDFIAHQMGVLIYNKKGFDGMTICTTDFGFGCYHGFLDKAFSKNLLGLPQAIKACQKLGPLGSDKFEGCAHGIGHGVASYYMVSDLPNALKTCETLSAGQMSCVDGVFMEFSIDAPPSFYNAKDPLYPCDTVGKEYTHACGRYQPTIMGKLGIKKKDIASVCFKSSDNNFQSGCFDALAFSTTYESGGDPQYVINQCSQILSAASFKNECLKAAAGGWVFQNMPGWKTIPFSICDAIVDQGKTDCYQFVNSIIQQYR